MTTEQYYKNLKAPDHKVDVILDTDAYNEVDDQFAVAYAMTAEDIDVLAMTAAPFTNPRSVSPEDGIQRRSVAVPLRSLLPQGLGHIAVIGLGAGVDRDVQPIIRMQADLMNEGYATGLCAAEAAKLGRRALVVSYDDNSVTGTLAKLKDLLSAAGVASQAFLEVTPNPPIEMVARGVEAAKAFGEPDRSDLLAEFHRHREWLSAVRIPRRTAWLKRLYARFLV